MIKCLIKNSLCFIGLISFVSIASAAPLSPRINVPGGGPVGPNQTIKISIEPITKHYAPYDIHCTIIDKNNVHNPDIMLFNTFGNAGVRQFERNGQACGWNCKLDKVKNSFVAIATSQMDPGGESGYLTFTNLDQSDTVTVSDCYAVPTL